MDLNQIAKSTCWQVKLPQNILTRLENVSGEFRIADDPSAQGAKVVHIVIDDEISRVAKALHCLHQHRIADNIQTCPESIEHIDLSHLTAADRTFVRESHKNITWQRTVFRARHDLQLTGLILPAIDGLEPALWPSADVLLHRLRLQLHAAYNTRNIPADKLEHAICVQESERTVNGVFFVDQMPNRNPAMPSWMVRQGMVERSITKRLTVYSHFQYCQLDDIPVSAMGHRRLEILTEGILRHTADHTVTGFNGPELLRKTLHVLLEGKTEDEGELLQDFIWKQLRNANLVFLAPSVEAILRADSPLARRRILQFLCSATMRQSIYANYPLFNVESQHIYRSQKVSLVPGVYALFVCVSDEFRAENMTGNAIGNVFCLLYGSSVTVSDLGDLYREENLLRSIHLKENAAAKVSPYRVDQQFFFDRYNLHRYQSNREGDLEQAAYSTPFIIPEDKAYDTIDLAPAMYANASGPRRRRKHQLKNNVDDETLQKVLMRKFNETVDASLHESELFNHFGDSARVKAILNKIALSGQSGRARSWTLRQEFAQQ